MKSISEHHIYIPEQLKKQQYIKITKELDVTTVVIRKGLKAFEKRALLFRTHGSAPGNLDIIITDDGITDSMAKMLDKIGIKLIIAT